MRFMQVPESAWPALARLSGLQVGIWADAWTWQQQGQRAFRSNDQFAKMFGCNERSIRRAISQLVDLGLVEIKRSGQMRFIHAKADQSVHGPNGPVKEDQSDREGGPNGPVREDQSVHQVYQSKSLSKSPIKSLRLRADLEGEEKGDLHFPWDTDAFLMTWEAYKTYMKKEHRFYFKSQRTEQIALFKISNQFQDEHTAIRAIGQAIANGWKGIPAPKARSGNNRPAQGYSPEGDQEAAARGNY